MGPAEATEAKHPWEGNRRSPAVFGFSVLV
jgi:hypothetical protein